MNNTKVLTDDEIRLIGDEKDEQFDDLVLQHERWLIEFSRAIEAAVLEKLLNPGQFEIKIGGIAPRDGCYHIKITNHYFNKEHFIKLAPKNGEMSVYHKEHANGWD